MATALVPTESIQCLALLRPGSKLHKRWVGQSSELPVYLFYEFSKPFGTYEVRYGGQSMRLTPEDHRDLILLREFSGDRLDAFANTCDMEEPDAADMARARGG